MNPAQYQVDQMAASADSRQCFKCNYEGIGDVQICPQCRKNTFFSSSNIRTRGVIAIVMGVLIAGIIAGVAIIVGTLLLGSTGNPETSRRLAEEQTTLLAIYGFFVLLIGLGLYFTLVGAWMAAFGKRNKYLAWMIWPAIVLVLVVGNLLVFWIE